MKDVSSLQNPLIKNLIKLQEKSRARKKQQLFVVEGQREVHLALEGGYILEQLFVVPTLVDELLMKEYASLDPISLSEDVYQKVAYRATTEGVLALVQWKSHAISDVVLTSKQPLIVVAEGIEKPGNIGAILRTADAARVDAVCIADPKTDIYNPNTIRSSVGTVFTNQIIIGTSEEISAFLMEQQIAIYAATLQNSNPYTAVEYTKASALVVGTEATGLSEHWRSVATQNINIPMHGHIDSMNVSVAAAILIFEAKRQRS